MSLGLLMSRTELDQKRATLDWGAPLETLPVVSWDDYVAETQNGKALIAVAGVIHDVTKFIADHPGGKLAYATVISIAPCSDENRPSSHYIRHRQGRDGYLQRRSIQVSPCF
jgi:hypothetical protein